MHAEGINIQMKTKNNLHPKKEKHTLAYETKQTRRQQNAYVYETNNHMMTRKTIDCTRKNKLTYIRKQITLQRKPK